MAYTQTDLDNVKAAIAGGELSVSLGDKTVTYRSLDDLLRVKRIIEDELATGSATRRLTPRYRTASFAD